jgi:hypothetical protein
MSLLSHRDVAARNCTVTNDLAVKISSELMFSIPNIVHMEGEVIHLFLFIYGLYTGKYVFMLYIACMFKNYTTCMCS